MRSAGGATVRGHSATVRGRSLAASSRNVQRAPRAGLARARAAAAAGEHKLGAAVSDALERVSIVFVGMMGSGKSTIARQVAHELSYTHMDSDTVIEGVSGKSIAELFESEGESGFRELESQVLQELCSHASLCLSTGGGAVSVKSNWGYMRNGIVVWIDVPLDVLAERVVAEGEAKRPLLADAEAESEGDAVHRARAKLEPILEKRLSLYEEADVRIEAGDAAVEGVVQMVLEALSKRLAESDTKDRLRSAPTEPATLEDIKTGDQVDGLN
mmetsp:Transcript_12668/g.41755  ORF Transcript_12668/g.41755 Transcript_12668/m.41755 type:complete len:272 (+) Transcript_12668:74-889(+)